MDGGLEDSVLGDTPAGEAEGSTAVVGDSAAPFGAVVHDDENESQLVAGTAVSTSSDDEIATCSMRSTADEVVADDGEGGTNIGDGEPTAAAGPIATTSSIASPADEVVAPQGDEAVTVGDDTGGMATNVVATAAAPAGSDEDTLVNVELLAARNPDEPSREEIGDLDIIIDIPSQEPREETTPAIQPRVQFSHGCTIKISKVGVLTRNVDEMEYEPQHVSIGPYCRIDKPELARDDEKKGCLEAILASNPNPDATEQDYLEALASLEDEARSCYDDPFSTQSGDFVRQLLLDGCYLLHRFGKVVGIRIPEASGNIVQGGSSSSSTVLASGGGDNKQEDVAVARDALFLVENQIPFFVVEKIHEITTSGSSTSAAYTITAYVSELLKLYEYSRPLLELPSETGNVLHLVHMHLKPSALSSAGTHTRVVEPTGERVGRWRSATDYYHRAGVKFKWRPVGDGTNKAQCILDVKLSSGGSVLEIPRLNIHGETWRLLRNLMALEQQNRIGNHVTAYCVFMSQLASTERDVELLFMDERIIQHGIGNNAKVASLFSDLCNGIVFDPNDADYNYLREYCQKLEKRYRSLLPRWIAWLKHKYFSNPCLAIGLAALTIGLFCAIVQTVYSVMSYYYPHGGY